MVDNKYSGKRIFDLPTEIIENIFFFLPSATIQGPLLVVRKLRPLIINKYFTEEIQLHLEPIEGSRWFGASIIEDKFKVNQIGGIEKIKRFLTENSDIVPHKYVVISDERRLLLSRFLQSFRSILSRAPELEIKFPSPDPSEDKVDGISEGQLGLIYSFPNICSLDVWSYDKFTSLVSPPASIKRFKLDGLGTLDWSCVKLPPNLTHLDIDMADSWNGVRVGWNVTYDVLFRLLSAKLPGNLAINHSTFNESLVFLRISNCILHSLDLSLFPSTLEHLEFSRNDISSIAEGSANLSWPKGLKHLSLRSNLIDDITLKGLSELGWPCRLEQLDLRDNQFEFLGNITGLPRTLKILRLGGNYFKTLDGLQVLPSTLEVLDFQSSTRFKTLRVSHNPDEYPYYKFPESLRRLFINYCSEFSWDVSHDGDSRRIPHRVRFPRYLECLDLSATNLTNLGCLVFPQSLKRFASYFNHIHDLNSYNSRKGSGQKVSWEQLTSLQEIELERSDVRTLKDWVPPRSLRKLRLSNNNLNCSELRAIPLFNRNFHEFTDNLRELYFSGIDIDVSDPGFYLPQNLTVLDLSANKHFRLESFSLLSRHENLVQLNLGENGIGDMPPSWKLPPNLKLLGLSSNNITAPECLDSLASHEHLEVLDLGKNEIERISPSWNLPRKLKSLDLSYNPISTFEFTHSFASHEHLTFLDLSCITLDKICVRHPERTYSSHLKFLDLSAHPFAFSDARSTVSAADLYCALESMGIKVTRRDGFILTEHQFA